MICSKVWGGVAAAAGTAAVLLVCLCTRVAAQSQPESPVTAGQSQQQSLHRNPERSYTALNAQLLQFCRNNIGERVGSGQCADLVEEGLKAVHAQTRAADYPNDGDYVWGVFVCSLEATNGVHRTQLGQAGKSGRVEPGDVIQFRNAMFHGRTPTGTYTDTSAHHTAVVEEVSEDNCTCRVIDQNSQNKLYVARRTLYLPDLQNGWLRVYRPIASASRSTAQERPARAAAAQTRALSVPRAQPATRSASAVAIAHTHANPVSRSAPTVRHRRSKRR